jgi:hypothetical protein
MLTLSSKTCRDLRNHCNSWEYGNPKHKAVFSPKLNAEITNVGNFTYMPPFIFNAGERGSVCGTALPII